MSTKPEHRRLYSGSYTRRARIITRNARNDPTTICGAPPNQCRGWGNRTIAEHPPTTTGKPPQWHAGHAWPNDPHAPLTAWVSGCNIAEGNDRRRGNPHSEPW